MPPKIKADSGSHWLLRIEPAPADFAAFKNWMTGRCPSALVTHHSGSGGAAPDSVTIKFAKKDQAVTLHKELSDSNYPVSKPKVLKSKEREKATVIISEQSTPITPTIPPEVKSKQLYAWVIRYEDAPYSEDKMNALKAIVKYIDPAAGVSIPNAGQKYGFINFHTEEPANIVHAGLTALKYRIGKVVPNKKTHKTQGEKEPDSKQQQQPKVATPITPAPVTAPISSLTSLSSALASLDLGAVSSAPAATQIEGQLASGIQPINDPTTGKPLAVSLGVASLGLYLRKAWLPTFPSAAMLDLASDNLSITWKGGSPDMAGHIQAQLMAELQTLCAGLTDIRQTFLPVETLVKYLVSSKCERINSAANLLAGCAAIEQSSADGQHVTMEFSCVVQTSDVGARTAVAAAFAQLAAAQKFAMISVPGVPLTEENKRAAADANCILIGHPGGAGPLLITAFESLDAVAAKKAFKL